MRRESAPLSCRAIVAVLVALLAVGCAPAPPPGGASAARPGAAAAKPAEAPSRSAVEEFYRGKVITIVVGSTAGGGYDVYSRTLARHVRKYIPGEPSVIVENRPGAATMLAANTVYHTAPKDGTVIVNFGGQMVLEQLFGSPGVEFDLRRFSYLDEPTPQTAACALTVASGFNSVEEATGARELILGGLTPGSLVDNPANVLKNVLGYNVKVVSGYSGTAQVRLAAEQGELMGGCWQWESIKTTWAEGLANGIVKMAVQGGRQPHPDLPTVPLMRDLARTAEQRELVDAAITNMTEMYAIYALPPGVPAERVAALRQAVAQAWKDPALIEDAEKSQLALNPVPASIIEQRVQEFLSLPPDTVEKLRRVLHP
jgi:hypothetical protein